MKKAKHAKKLAVLMLFAGAPATAQCELGTSYAGTRETPDGGTAMFDVSVASWPIEIGGLGLEVAADQGTPFHVDVYTTQDTFVGKELDPTQWTLRTSGRGLANRPAAYSWVTLDETFSLDAGSSQGMAVVITGAGHRYHDGSSVPRYYENKYMSIQMGAVTSGPFGPTTFLPGVWNGKVIYDSLRCGCPHACNFDYIYACICDIFDVLEFQNSFVNGESCSCDFDTSTGAGVCDIFDFLAFQNEFVGPCP